MIVALTIGEPFGAGLIAVCKALFSLRRYALGAAAFAWAPVCTVGIGLRPKRRKDILMNN